jgi:hypothetical protein
LILEAASIAMAVHASLSPALTLIFDTNSKLTNISSKKMILRTTLLYIALLSSSAIYPACAAAVYEPGSADPSASFLKGHRMLQMGMGKGGGHMGGGGMGMGMGGGGRSEMATIHNLVDNRHDIQRIVNMTDDGISSTTWSENEKVSAWIKQHVAEMSALLESSGRIRQWDDLFVKVFDMRDSHTMEYHERDDGMGVVVEQYGINKCAIGLVQAHAKVVSAFIREGYDEVHKNHNVPAVCEEEDDVQWNIEVEEEDVINQEVEENVGTLAVTGDGVNGGEYADIDTVSQEEGGNGDALTLLEEEIDQGDEAEDIDEEERQILSLEKEKTLDLSSISDASAIAAGLSVVSTTMLSAALAFVVALHV